MGLFYCYSRHHLCSTSYLSYSTKRVNGLMQKIHDSITDAEELYLFCDQYLMTEWPVLYNRTQMLSFQASVHGWAW